MQTEPKEFRIRILFVRHGHPDYQKDCLTELGHRHGEAVARRLAEESIDKVFSSNMGRAVETAGHIAALLGLDVTQLAFMRELRWGPRGDTPIPLGGHPWHTAEDMAAQGLSLLSPHWETEAPFRENKVVDDVRQTAAAFDLWLQNFGLERDGAYYRITAPQNTTVALVSHAGSSGAVLAHLLNLPFPFVCAAMGPNFTAVTSVVFRGEAGTRITPKLELLNDDRHIRDISEDVFYGN